MAVPVEILLVQTGPMPSDLHGGINGGILAIELCDFSLSY
jgi:hypothetical protein